jgi:hypothetical protein
MVNASFFFFFLVLIIAVNFGCDCDYFCRDITFFCTIPNTVFHNMLKVENGDWNITFYMSSLLTSFLLCINYNIDNDT